MENHVTQSPAPMDRRMWKLVRIFGLAVCLMWTACVIVEVEMPETANTGEVIDVTIAIAEDNAESNTPWKGVFSVLVPNDWSFVSGEYSALDLNGDVGSGMLEKSSDWTDSTEKAIPAPDGMMWVGTISDEGYLHTDSLTVEVSLKLKVGETPGEYAIGYVVTKEAYFPTCDWFQTCGEDSINGADSSMNNMITVMGSTSVEDVIEDGVPSQFVLEQNYPNPFNPTTTIRYAVEEAAHVNLAVYDLVGREVSRLVDTFQSPGVYEAQFDAVGLPSGTYLYRMEAGEYSTTRTMLLTK